MGHIRAFLALSLSPQVRVHLHNLQQKLRSSLPPVNWVRPESIHVTVKFLGTIPAQMADQLLEALRGLSTEVSPFSLNIQGIGVFPDMRSPRVLWAGLTGPVDKLIELHKHIQLVLEPLGFPIEEKAFHPHVTLARIKWNWGRVGKALAAGGYLESREVVSTMVVNQVVLYRSELSSAGSRYEVLGRLPFIGSPEAG